MKKIVLFISFIIVICLFCHSINLFLRKEEMPMEQISLKTGIYVIENSSNTHNIPYLSLKDNNEFVFQFSVLASNVPLGTYEIKDNLLILTSNNADKSKETFVFEINDKKLTFKESGSNKLPAFSNKYIYDGVTFILSED